MTVAAVVKLRVFERLRAALRFGRNAAVILRAGLGGFTATEGFEKFLGRGAIEVFVEILADLEHRRVHTGAKAFDFHPRKLAVCGNRVLRRRDVLFAGGNHIIRTAQPARRRRANLHQMIAHRLEIEHRVKRRHFQHADVGHGEHRGDVFDHRLGDPAILFLPAPQKRDHRAGLTAGGIFRHFLFGPRLVLRREREARGLMFCETADAQRSISPKTMSSEPITAGTSASRWPLHIYSSAARCG